jgi:hypothetical protein
VPLGARRAHAWRWLHGAAVNFLLLLLLEHMKGTFDSFEITSHRSPLKNNSTSLITQNHPIWVHSGAYHGSRSVQLFSIVASSAARSGGGCQLYTVFHHCV